MSAAQQQWEECVREREKKMKHYCHIMIKLQRNRNIQSDGNRNAELCKRPKKYSIPMDLIEFIQIKK